jgi:hypothetical protein
VYRAVCARARANTADEPVIAPRQYIRAGQRMAGGRDELGSALTAFANFRLKPDAEPLQQVTPCRLMGSGRE